MCLWHPRFSIWYQSNRPILQKNLYNYKYTNKTRLLKQYDNNHTRCCTVRPARSAYYIIIIFILKTPCSPTEISSRPAKSASKMIILYRVDHSVRTRSHTVSGCLRKFVRLWTAIDRRWCSTELHNAESALNFKIIGRTTYYTYNYKRHLKVWFFADVARKSSLNRTVTRL